MKARAKARARKQIMLLVQTLNLKNFYGGKNETKARPKGAEILVSILIGVGSKKI